MPGVTVPPEDAAALTAAIAALADDRAERDRLGANGRRWVEQWLSPAAVAEAYETLFAELIAARRD